MVACASTLPCAVSGYHHGKHDVGVAEPPCERLATFILPMDPLKSKTQVLYLSCDAR